MAAFAPEVRTFRICMMADVLEVSEPVSSTVIALKTRLFTEHRFQEMPRFFYEESGVELMDDAVVKDVVDGASLICITSGGVVALEAQVKELASPGCQYQKYLRWLVDVEAGDPRILQTLWVIAVLPASRPAASSVFDGDASKNEPQPCQKAYRFDEVCVAALVYLGALWQPAGMLGQSEEQLMVDSDFLALHRGTPATAVLLQRLWGFNCETLKQMLLPHYRSDVHIALLKSVCTSQLEVGEPRNLPHSPVLRTALAQVQQILCRDLRRFLEDIVISNRQSDAYTSLGKGRQSDAYTSLVKIASCEETRLWA